MRCRTAERLIYLHREGERSPARERRLDRHLQNCPSCGAEARRIRDTLDRVEGLKDPEHGTSDPMALTESILTRIRYLEGGVRARSGARLASPFGRRTFGSRIQPIVAAAVLLLVVGILTEGFLILDRITLLEKRLEGYRTSPITTASIVSTEVLNRGLQQLRELEARIEARIGIDPSLAASPDEWIVIRRSDLDQLLARYMRTDASPETLLRVLVRQLPELREITLMDGLNRTELQVLIDHSPEIIRAVRRL